MSALHARTSRNLLAATLALMAMPLQAATPPGDSYSFAPVPAWVAPIDAGAVRADVDAVYGQRHRLVDRQYFQDDTVAALHRHHVSEVTGQAGLSDASQLSISFDPGYQRLELHSATVTRDGRESDRLERARIDVARTENDTDSDLLNGEVTALVVFPDVRVGDRVETRYTVHGRNPVLGSRHFSSWRVRWSVPVERSVFRLTVPRSVALDHTPRPESRFTDEVAGEFRTLQWHWDALDASEAPSDTPAGFTDPDLLEITAYRSWQEVADWGAALFEDQAADSDAYRRLSRTLQDIATTDGLEPAIAKAIDHVQRRIRYHGLELGENSHQPHAPDKVLTNGYGDCKDKALLLTALLNDLGVDAWPILVSMRDRDGVADRLPSPGAFDHVVVLVEHGGKQFWVDATSNRQSGLLGLRGQPEYGAGVVLGKPGEALLTRAAPIPELAGTETHDEFHLSGVGGPVDFVTSSTYRGGAANWFRGNLDRTGKRRLQKRYSEFYEEVYGRLRVLEPLRIVEDATANVFTVTETYRLEAFWDVARSSRQADFEAFPISVRNRVPALPKVKRGREAPLAIRGPVRAAHRIQFYPNVASDARPLEEIAFDMDGFRYRHSEYVVGDSLVFDSEIVITTDTLPADRIEAYGTFRDRVLRNARSGRFYRQIDAEKIELGSKTALLLNDLEELFR